MERLLLRGDERRARCFGFAFVQSQKQGKLSPATTTARNATSKHEPTKNKRATKDRSPVFVPARALGRCRWFQKEMDVTENL